MHLGFIITMELEIEKEFKLAGMYRRGVAFVIDEFIVLIIRVIIITIAYLLFFQEEVTRLGREFYASVNIITETHGTFADFLEMLQSLHAVKLLSIMSIIFCITHPVYQLIMYKYCDGQTFGKKATGIVVLTGKLQKMRLSDIITRVIFCYLPWVLPILIYYLYINASIFFIPVTIVWFFWYDPWIILGKRGKTLHDILSNTYTYVIIQPAAQENSGNSGVKPS